MPPRWASSARSFAGADRADHRIHAVLHAAFGRKHRRVAPRAQHGRQSLQVGRHLGQHEHLRCPPAGRGARQVDPETAAAVQARAQFDPAAQQCGEPRHDGQAQPEPLAVVALGVADLEEFVEDPRLVHRRDADAAVAHFDAHALAADARRQQYPPARRGGVDRVVQQPPQQARQQSRVGGDRQRVRMGMQGHARAMRPVAMGAEQFGEQVLQVAGHRLRLQAVGLELGQQQQAIEDVGHRPHAVVQVRQIWLLRRLRVAAQAGQGQIHRLQRLPQVVVAGGQEAFLRALRAIRLLHQGDHLGG